MDKLHRIGKYEVIPAVLGDGGFCCVYPCEYDTTSSGSRKVAVKISLVPVEDCSHDMKVAVLADALQLLFSAHHLALWL